MPDANLLQKLKINPSGLTNLMLFGRIRSMIKTPSILSFVNTTGDGAFAILDVFAVKCLVDDHFAERGTRNKDQIYNTKGSVIIYLNKPSLVGKYVKVSGRSATRGVTVKQNKNHQHPSDGIVAFVWTRDRDKWLLEPNFVSELGKDDPNIVSTPFLEYVIKYIGENTEIEEYPVSGIMEFEGVREYEEIDPSSIVGVEGKVHHSEERLDLSKIDLKLTYHETGVELPEYYKDVEEEIKIQSRKRLDYAKKVVLGVKNSYKDNAELVTSAATSIRQNFIDGIVANYAYNVGVSGVKGREYLEAFLKCLTSEGFDDKDRRTEKEVNEIREKVLENPYSLGDSSVLDLAHVKFASMVIGLSTGIGYEGLVNNFKSTKRTTEIDVDVWFYMLLSNPYLCAILGCGVSTLEADVVYYSYSKFFATSIVDSTECRSMRDRLTYLKVLDELSEEDSIVPKSEVNRYAYVYEGMRFIERNRFILKKDLVELLSVICGSRVELSERELQYLTKSDNWRDSTVCKFLLNNGIVNEVNDGLMLEVTLEKEALIFKVFQEKGIKTTGITLEQCEAVCNDFENRKFTLEPLQRKGVGLIRYSAAVLTGCAGSGKTTTSDVMVEGLEKHLSGYKLVYCAPTGKAARRMAEVLSKSVRTVHSEFKIGVGTNDSYLSKVYKKRGNPGDANDSAYKGKVYIIDESGMLNRELLYEIARNLKEEDIIYFLGDIKQLPPIGTGCPFYNLMSILPCVELGVSKRAAAGSLVNYNTTVINCLSDGVMEGIITDDDTFISVNCANEAIAENVLKLWKRFMSEGKSEDDIQVISAYVKSDCLYSSTTLNPILQKYLRRNDMHCFRYVDFDFYKNDRVIHANSNVYGMKRFIKTGPMQYEEVLSLGVVNGELGKIVGCYDSRMFTFTELESCERTDLEQLGIEPGKGYYENVSEECFEDMLDNRKTYEDEIEFITTRVNEYTWFVEFEVMDVNLKKPVSIFYEGRLHNQDGIISLTGGLLGNIELAYALTCHKMQGSQIPVALISIGSDANPNFVNRNMLNTMITRSQGIVGLIGDIDNNDSAFNKGRTKVANYRNESLLTDLCEEARQGG